MKKFSHLVLGLASIAMLASCAKDITADEASKIAAGWNTDQLKSYSIDRVTTKNSKGDTNLTTNEYTGIAGVAALALEQKTNVGIVALAASAEGSTFKADGTALEITYTDSSNNKYQYKTNEAGLTTYYKVTTTDKEGKTTWTEEIHNWSK